MIKKFLLILPLTLLANDNNVTKLGEMLYIQNSCGSCHGMNAEGIGATPRLQGKKESILLRRLKELQKGKTKTAFGGVMVSFAKSLDENQTKIMAKYLSHIPKREIKEEYEDDYENSSSGS